MGISTTKLHVKLTFIESILGTAAADPQVYEKYIASRAVSPATVTDENGKDSTEMVADLAKSQEETAVIADMTDGADNDSGATITVFPKEDGKPFFWDYQIKGFLKDACGMLSRVKGSECSKVKAYKKVIDGLIFPKPRKIFIETDKPITLCSRPLRAQTAQGERIAIACSEEIAEGATCEFDIELFEPSYVAMVKEILDYGEYRGTSQWRNSGKGRFTWELLEE